MFHIYAPPAYIYTLTHALDDNTCTDQLAHTCTHETRIRIYDEGRCFWTSYRATQPNGDPVRKCGVMHILRCETGTWRTQRIGSRQTRTGASTTRSARPRMCVCVVCGVECG